MEDIIKKQIDQELTIVSNEQIADKVFKMVLKGDTSLLTAPGQFINIKLPEFYLRRPISVSDYDSEGLTIIYKVVGNGTDYLSTVKQGEKLNCLMGLGNVFSVAACGAHVLLVG
ncbi:MAG: dihydroorotate dehydrogenase electron transfer subunit, partial [Lachnospiraceae bacterium]|nr:dihydroorotate dehydrogenase electron transfer subunit [Lachnospiraceae bacterium]